jgi:hypothetical protein
MRHFHEPAGFNETNDPATWDAASYSVHPVDSLEPLPDVVSDYREAALHFCRIMFCVDEFITTAPDARFAVIVVAVALDWPSVRGMTAASIAEQLGCSPATITRACVGGTLPSTLTRLAAFRLTPTFIESKPGLALWSTSVINFTKPPVAAH